MLLSQLIMNHGRETHREEDEDWASSKVEPKNDVIWLYVTDNDEFIVKSMVISGRFGEDPTITLYGNGYRSVPFEAELPIFPIPRPSMYGG